MSSARRQKLALAALIALFVLGSWALVAGRFDAGDIYPPGSSMRGDPQGTKVLYRALSESDRRVSRNLDADPALPAEPHDLVLVIAALDPCDLVQGSQILGAADDLARRGTRVLLLLDDQQLSCTKSGRSPVELFSRGQQGGPSLLGHWGLALEALGPASTSTAVRDDQAPLAVPSHVTLPGRLAIAALSPEWQVVLRREQRPVAAVRHLGEGSLALLTSTFPLTNEAMSRARSTELVTWLLGGRRRVVFDEVHLGLSAESGVVQMLGSLHLYGACTGLLALFALSVWRRSARFCPRHATSEPSALQAGVPQELVALLMRALHSDELVKTCVRERLATMAARERSELSLPALARANHPNGAGDVAEHYNALVQLFSGKHRS